MDMQEVGQLVGRGLTILLLTVSVGVVIFILRAFWIEFRDPPSPAKIKAIENGSLGDRERSLDEDRQFNVTRTRGSVATSDPVESHISIQY